MDVIHQRTRLKPNHRMVHFDALFMLQASPARLNVTNYVLDLNAVSRSVLIPLSLDGALIRIKKRVQDVCTKSNICLITEEAESLKGAVRDKCKKAAYLCQEEVMAPTCYGAQSATDYAIRKQNHFKYEAVGFFVFTVKSTL
jgi:enhancing lycopene biosynthesis protein 2